MIEKIAYRGQQAAYMGIVMHMYMQQGLGALMQTLQSDNVDSDKAIQQVRDVFAMSTKSLDQVGRTGTFHHIVRRQVAMTDTGLYEIDEARDLSDLPLSADGVFGSDFEKFLKTRKEKNKALDDLLPDISVKKSYLEGLVTVEEEKPQDTLDDKVRKVKFPKIHIPVGGRLTHFLQEWEQITQDQWVLSIIKDGYKLEFLQKPPFQGIKKTVVSTKNLDILNLEINSLLEKGAIEKVPVKERMTGFYITLFVL
ncbi:Hypothetical predicted protein [Mytilus galloprovincialis]|uniref:Uncharacterized protein n=1 Tax=Mytilus galloprovincialis TaxID=29158 RepID=A0A8B6CRY5_MYTGA|nr:Hypothetical predicted protein [Mytilus galloprovincialis]